LGCDFFIYFFSVFAVGVAIHTDPLFFWLCTVCIILTSCLHCFNLGELQCPEAWMWFCIIYSIHLTSLPPAFPQTWYTVGLLYLGYISQISPTTDIEYVLESMQKVLNMLLFPKQHNKTTI
jgi:hypothetical protein